MKTFLFNPYTGTPRHPLDIQSDPEGLLIHDSTEPQYAATPPSEQVAIPGQESVNGAQGEVQKDAERAKLRFDLMDAIGEHAIVFCGGEADPARKIAVRKKLDSVIDLLLPGTEIPRLASKGETS